MSSFKAPQLTVFQQPEHTKTKPEAHVCLVQGLCPSRTQDSRVLITGWEMPICIGSVSSLPNMAGATRPPTVRQGPQPSKDGGHSSKGRKRTKWLQLPIPQEAAPPQPHSHKASSFQELVFIIKVIFDVNKMSQLQKKLRTLQSISMQTVKWNPSH